MSENFGTIPLRAVLIVFACAIVAANGQQANVPPWHIIQGNWPPPTVSPDLIVASAAGGRGAALSGTTYTGWGTSQSGAEFLGRQSNKSVPIPVATPDKVVVGCYEARNHPIEGRIRSMYTCQDLFNWALFLAADSSKCNDTTGTTTVGGIWLPGFGGGSPIDVRRSWPDFNERTPTWGRGFGKKRRRRHARGRRQESAWPGGPDRQVGSRLTTGAIIPLDQSAQGTCQLSPNVGNCDVADRRINSIFIEFEFRDLRVVATNGIPIHEYHHGGKIPNPTPACEQYKVLLIPRNPRKWDNEAQRFDTGVGSLIGISRSGAFLFSHTIAPTTSGNPCNLATVLEADNFDACGGHANQNCEYHYHAMPSKACLAQSECILLGYIRDGFPIYSQCNNWRSCYQLADRAQNRSYEYQENGRFITVYSGCSSNDYVFSEAARGRGDCDLDEANGRFYNGQYAYFFSANFPFIVPKYAALASKMCTVVP